MIGRDSLPSLNWRYGSILAVLCLFFACGNLWPIDEADVFHHVRAGGDILEKGYIYERDDWSHTAFQKPVYNFEWLSNVMVRVVYDIGRYDALTVFRVVLFGIWLFGILLFIPRGGVSSARWLECVLIIGPWMYLISYFRFELRPDIFPSIIFMGFVHFWQRAVIWNTIKYAVVFFVCLTIWSNFHGGTVSIGIGGAVLFTFIARKDPIGVRFILALGFAITLFLNPQGINILEVLRDAVFKYNYSETLNRDHRPLSLALVDWRQGSWTILWIPFVIVWLSQVFRLCSEALRRGFQRGNVEQRVLLFNLVFGVMLLVLTAVKFRAVAYQIAFASALAVPAIAAYWTQSPTSILAKLIRPLGFTLVIVTIGIAVLLGKTLGTGLSIERMPVWNARKLAEKNFEHELLNHYNFGGYLIHAAPNFKVSMDPRELQFKSFMGEMKGAIESEDKYKSFEEFLAKYKINTVLWSYFVPRKKHDGTYFRFLDLPIANQNWALVGVDNASLLFIRRMPSHSKLIQEAEYKYLAPGMPLALAMDPKLIDEANLKRFEAEVDRCLLESDSQVIYCMVMKASFLIMHGQIDKAEEILLKSLRIGQPRSDALRLLAVIYLNQGKSLLGSYYQIRSSFGAQY